GAARDARELELSLRLVGVVIGAHGYASEENRRASERTVHLARALDAPDALVTGLFGLAGYHAHRADLDAAGALTDEMLAVGRRTGARAPARRPRAVGHGRVLPRRLRGRRRARARRHGALSRGERRRPRGALRQRPRGRLLHVRRV